MLDCIASALQLTKDERSYLFALALENGPGNMPFEQVEVSVISPPLQKILQELTTCPTLISDRRCGIVGWNEAAAHVFWILPHCRKKNGT